MLHGYYMPSCTAKYAHLLSEHETRWQNWLTGQFHDDHNTAKQELLAL